MLWSVAVDYVSTKVDYDFYKTLTISACHNIEITLYYFDVIQWYYLFDWLQLLIESVLFHILHVGV